MQNATGATLEHASNLRRPRSPARATLALAVLMAGAAVAWFGLRGTGGLEVDAAWFRVRELGGERLEPESALGPGDCLELELHSSERFHVYVLHEDVRGAASLLYPLEGLDRQNPMTAGSPVRLPGTVDGANGCWRLEDEAGTATMVVIASRKPLPDLEQALVDLPPARNVPALGGRPVRHIRGVASLGPAPGSRVDSRLSRIVRSVTRESPLSAGVWVSRSRFPSGASSRSGLDTAALRLLEREVDERPNDPTALLSLAQALMGDRDDPTLLLHHARAYELAARASDLVPLDTGACRLRAKALQGLSIDRRAAEILDDCSRLDGAFREVRVADVQLSGTAGDSAAWNDERERLLVQIEHDDEVDDAVAMRFPHRVRELVEHELLVRWADRYLASEHAVAERIARHAGSLGRAVQEATGDALSADAVGSIVALHRPRNGATLRRLAEAHLAYRRAEELVRQRACEDAEPMLHSAAESFRAAGSPFHLKTDLQRGICRYYANDYDQADSVFNQLLRLTETTDYYTLLGVTHRMLGLSVSRRSRYRAGVHHFAEAARRFSGTGDDAQLADVRNLEAQSFDRLGEYDRAWVYRHGAMSRLGMIDDARLYNQITFNASVAAARQGFLRLAVELATLAVRSASASSDTLAFIVTNLRLATFLDTLDREPDALMALDTARSWLARLPLSARAEYAAETAVVEARLAMDVDPRAAVLALDEAISFYEIGQQEHLAQLYPLRGRAHLEAGQFDEAEADIRAGIEFFERNRENISDETTKISYSDVASGVYDEMIRLQAIVKGQPAGALDYAERGRARLLLQRTNPRSLSSQPLDSKAIVRDTPASAALVYYSVLEDRLLVWVSAGGRLHFVDRPIRRDDLDDSISALRARLQTGDGRDSIPRESHELYDTLIAPVRDKLEPGMTLVLLPDKALHRVPFEALVDRDTGRYLIQDFAVAVSPSATLLLRPAADRPAPAGGALDALIVGDPEFDHRLFGDLPRLPGAAIEARAVAALYDSHELLLGPSATSSRFLGLLDRSRVVHFGGHAIPNEADPMNSLLVLAPDAAAGDSGELQARDLYGRAAGSTELVVLAACSTATGRVSAAEGTISLARPFLAAGVSYVVATLWQLDDEAGAAMFVRFHQAHRRTGNPIDALHEAQIDLLESTDDAFKHPRFWASARVFLGPGALKQGG